MFVRDFLIFILLVAIVSLFVKQSRLSRRLQRLETSQRTKSIQAQKSHAQEVSSAGSEPWLNEGLSAGAQRFAQQTKTVERPRKEPIAPKQSRPTTSSPGTFSRIEKLFAENLTGILGSLAFVIGTTFLFAYAALKLNEIFRFIILIAIALSLYAAQWFLRRNERFSSLGQWMGSAGAALFLLACFGASAIPGLRFIESLPIALVFLCAGIGANFFSALITNKQGISSLHVLLSLIPLAIVNETTTFLIGSIVALFGVILSFRKVWDVHLLITIVSFLFFSVYWWGAVGSTEGDPARLIYLIAVLSVTGCAALVHYRRDYALPKAQSLPLLVHLTNWACMGVSILLAGFDQKPLSIGLFVGAIAAFLLARQAKKKGISWVYHTDSILSFILLLSGIVSLGVWEIDWNFRVGIGFACFSLLAFFHLREATFLIYKVAAAISKTALVVLCFSLATRNFQWDSTMTILQMASVPLIILFGLAMHFLFLKHFDEEKDSISFYLPESKDLKASLTGILLGFVPAAAFFGFREFNWSVSIFCGFLLLFQLLSYFSKSKGLGLGALLGFAALAFSTWVRYFELQTLSWTESFVLGAPLIVLAGIFPFLPTYSFKGKILRWPSIYLLALHILATLFFTFNMLQPSLTALCLILLVPLLSEFARSIHSKDQSWSEPLLNVGYFYIYAFAGLYFVQAIQSEMLVGPVKIRQVVEVSGLSAIAFWIWNTRQIPNLFSTAAKEFLRSLPLEIFLSVLVTGILIEAPRQFHPIIWVLLAFAVARVSFLSTQNSRLRLYSVFFIWAAAIHLVAITSVASFPGQSWFHQPWIIGVLTFSGIGLFLYTHKNNFEWKQVHLVGLSMLLEPLLFALKKRTIELLYYPLFLAAGAFLYWRMESGALTISWVSLGFLIFVLGIALRMMNFLRMAFIVVAICMLRLIFFDLAESSVFLRGIVFMAIGGVLLAMNFIYRKYSHVLVRNQA